MSGEVTHRRGNVTPSTSSSSINDRRSSNATSERKSSFSINGSKYSKKEVTFRPDQPLHTAQDSLFSTSSGYTNYKGFFNLSMLLLVSSLFYGLHTWTPPDFRQSPYMNLFPGCFQHPCSFGEPDEVWNPYIPEFLVRSDVDGHLDVA